MKISFESQSWNNATMKATRIAPLVRICALNYADLQMGVARYRVVGSSGILYLVRFWEYRGILESDCTCKAGSKGYHCYHAAAAWHRHCQLVQSHSRPAFGSQWEMMAQAEYI